VSSIEAGFHPQYLIYYGKLTSAIIHFCYPSREEDLVAVAWELLHTLYFAGYLRVLKILGAWDII
jgi:hypothetical protein